MIESYRFQAIRNTLIPFCLAAFVVACASPEARFGDKPIEFTEAADPHGDKPFYNWPVPPKDIETKGVDLGFAGEAAAVDWQRTAKGASGPMEAVVDFPTEQKKVRHKLKMVPKSLDKINNSPRREVAAYEIQKLFLDPEDYVVPTTYLMCAPASPLEPHWDGANCPLLVASVWLVNVRPPAILYDVDRFVKEPNYAYYMSNLNLFTYLIAHGDGNPNNFLVSNDDARRQVFSIDNGVALGHIPNVFVRNWDAILIPALRKDSIDRLRALGREDLDFLEVVTELQLDERGVLVPVEPGANLNPKDGAKQQGDIIQFGLTTGEIDDLWNRIQTVIADVDAGKIDVF